MRPAAIAALMAALLLSTCAPLVPVMADEPAARKARPAQPYRSHIRMAPRHVVYGLHDDVITVQDV